MSISISIDYCIVGLGKTGLSVARFLQHHQHSFMMMDSRTTLSELSNIKHLYPTAEIILGNFEMSLLQQAEKIKKAQKIILSPGIPPEKFFELFGRENIISDIDLFAAYAKAPIIGITGTNAKGTVTTLLGDMINNAGLTALLGGNIGTPALDLLLDCPTPDYYVLELSSFQLDISHDLPLIVATILNISPDHLERHHTLENYIRAKQTIYNNTQTMVYNRDDAATHPLIKNKQNNDNKDNKKMFNFGLSLSYKPHEFGFSSGHFLTQGSEEIFSDEKLSIKGKHNILNTLAALALGSALGLPLEKMRQTLQDFKGLPHRCEWLGEKKNLYWINDSKGTNIGATIAAIQGFGETLLPSQKITLILGGLSKNQLFQDLKPSIHRYVREVILIGKDAPLIYTALETGVFAASLDEAILLAQQKAHKNDLVLFSPACASFDMFKDFEDRGRQFKLCVDKLS